MLPAVAHAGATADPPRISKPTPASPTTPNVLPLPPAQFDNTLAIGGKDVKAREIDTRLSVDVQVNGRGPYHFVVDSGADTSAVGLRIAHDLELPLGHSGNHERNDLPRLGRPGEGRRADAWANHRQKPRGSRLARGGSGRRRPRRHRRAGRAAPDDGFRKASDQGRGRAGPDQVAPRRDRDHRPAQARPVDPDRGPGRRDSGSTRSSTPDPRSPSAIRHCATS